MKNYKIKNDYTFLKFSDSKEMYDYLYELLKKGYEISDSFNLSVELKKNNEYLLLSYLDCEINENIKDNIKALYKKEELMYPDYLDTQLGIISGFRKNFGYDIKYPVIDGVFDKYYKKMIILILDGFGTNILMNNLDDNSFLRKNYLKSIHSIYPSTTAASTTSMKTGLSPYVTGWTGWENYFKEIDKNIILFTGKNFVTDEPTGISGYSKMPYKPFYSDMDKVKGYTVEPDFKKDNRTIDDILNQSLEYNKKDELQVQYVYYDEPDHLMHEIGPYDLKVKKMVNEFDKKIEAYANKLSNDTILVITADHGHREVKPIHIYDNKILNEFLERRPSNDARSITFKVKNGKEKEFENMFNILFKDYFKLFKTKDAIDMGFFGLKDDIRHERIDDFLADYIAVAINDRYFNYKGIPDFIFKSHHAGITKDEMSVPLIVIRK